MKWSLSKTKEILWTEGSSHLLTFHEVNAEHLEDILPELEIAERLLEEETKRRRENEKENGRTRRYVYTSSQRSP